jgi:putative membrane protein
MEAAMKQWIGVLALACAVGAASNAAAQTTPSSGSAQSGTTKGGATASKPQSGTKPQGSTEGTDRAAAEKGAKGASAAADTMFIKTAAMDGMAEVDHGNLAAQNATHDEVKQFGQRMAADHGKANDELKSIASQKNVTLPTQLDAKHQAMHDKLSKMKGDAFDRAYMQHMVTAHQQAVTLFQKESTSGKDAETKGFAGKTLPTLQEHLKMARDVNSKVAGAAKGAAAPKK